MSAKELSQKEEPMPGVRATVVAMCVLLAITIGAMWTGQFILAAICGLGAFASFFAMLIFVIMAIGDA